MDFLCVRIINGKKYKDIKWENMSEDMKEDIEKLVSMIYNSRVNDD
jgi:hypothetical protein